MIHVVDNLWIGDSRDEIKANVDIVLNVASDLRQTRRGEYVHIGLIDGPGNPPAMYCAAILALHTLLEKGPVLVCCHTGSRSLAVALMYLCAAHSAGWPGDWEAGWDEWHGIIAARSAGKLPDLHAAHREVFDKINWRLLATIMRQQ